MEDQAEAVIRGAARWHPLRRVSQSPIRHVDRPAPSAKGPDRTPKGKIDLSKPMPPIPRSPRDPKNRPSSVEETELDPYPNQNASNRNVARWHPLRRVSQSPDRHQDYRFSIGETEVDTASLQSSTASSNIAQWHPLRRISQSLDRNTTAHPGAFQRRDIDRHPKQVKQQAVSKLRPECDEGQPFFSALWRREVSVLVDPRTVRDHLANERTFLAWLRTSIAISMMGILTTQLFTLQATHLPTQNLSFYVLGVPLGSVCQAAALANILVGVHRFWRHQNAMVNGRACAGGWEILFIGGLVITLVLGFFTLILISHTFQPDV